MTIIIVNTNTRELVCQCIGSIYRNPPTCPYEVIVVDNASTDGSCKEIKAHFPAVQLIQNSRNVGFAAANNQAFDLARGSYFLLLNSDTVALPESLDKLLIAMERDKEVGIVAPRLIYPDGRLQMSYGAMPTLLGAFCSFFEVKRLIPRSLMKRMGRSPTNKLFGKTIRSYVSWFSGDSPPTRKLGKHLLVTGACMLIRRQCFEQVGRLDPAYFMYVDDADYCKRVHDAGWKIQYLSEAVIIHVKGGTVGERYRWTSPAAYHSIFYFLRKHRGAGISQIAKAFALASLSLRLVISTLAAPKKAPHSWKLLKEVAMGPEQSPSVTARDFPPNQQGHEDVPNRAGTSFS